jgi:hypothetical protein
MVEKESRILQIPDDWSLDKKMELVKQRLEYNDRVPDGKLDGIEFDQGHQYGGDKRNSVRDTEEWGRKYFDTAKKLFNNEVPDIYYKRLEEFENNISQVKKIASLELIERKSLPSHKIFPYFGNFEGFVKRSRTRFSKLEIDKLEFTERLIGRGGYSDIYLIKGEDKKYALKLMKGEYNMLEFDFQYYFPAIEFIFENLFENHKDFSEKPFLPILAMTDCHRTSFTSKWLIQEYFDGRSVASAIAKDGRKNIIKDKELIGNILLTYSEMLKSIHKNNRLFVDNNWGNVLFDDKKEIRICDYDVSRKIDEEVLDFKVFRYMPRESMLKTKRTIESEYEMFALMMDDLFFGYPFIRRENKYFPFPEKNMLTAIKKNKRGYPRPRREKLPKNLRQVCTNFIEYPRNKQKMDIEDIIGAIKLDYYK